MNRTAGVDAFGVSRGLLPLVLAIVGGASIGCAGTASWPSPGTMDQQRRRAELYDPYPDSRSGPAVPELRPREFQLPMAEPEKAQLYSERRRGAMMGF